MPTRGARKRADSFIEAAIAVIASHGVEGATTRRIAAEANAPLASLHYCFASKEDLLFETYAHLVNSLCETSLRVVPGCGLSVAAASIMRQLMNWYGSEPSHSAQVQLELYFWVSRQDPSVTRKVYDEALEAIELRLREAMLPDEDLSLVSPIAKALSAFVDGIITQSVLYADVPGFIDGTVDTAVQAIQLFASEGRPRIGGRTWAQQQA